MSKLSFKVSLTPFLRLSTNHQALSLPRRKRVNIRQIVYVKGRSYDPTNQSGAYPDYGRIDSPPLS